jgi:hypothetical protein
VLRDSLGGNCKTTMIATVNLDDDFTMESIATCKFAARLFPHYSRGLFSLYYRVALISNDANVNEHTDPKIVIAGLRQQIDMLKAELKASGKNPDEPDIPLSVDELSMYVALLISSGRCRGHKWAIEDQDVPTMYILKQFSAG